MQHRVNILLRPKLPKDWRNLLELSKVLHIYAVWLRSGGLWKGVILIQMMVAIKRSYPHQDLLKATTILTCCKDCEEYTHMLCIEKIWVQLGMQQTLLQIYSSVELTMFKGIKQTQANYPACSVHVNTCECLLNRFCCACINTCQYRPISSS